MGRHKSRLPWRRRLHVEALESRIAPGGLVDWLALGELTESFAAASHISRGALAPGFLNAGETQPDASHPEGTRRLTGVGTATDDILRDALASGSNGSQPGASAPRLMRTSGGAASDGTSSVARAAAFSALPALEVWRSDFAAIDPILKAITLAPSRPLGYGAGGGGASSVGGDNGGGGAGAPRTLAGPAAGAQQLASAAPAVQAPAATASASSLVLRDASGAAMDVALDENTIVVGAATWCGYTIELKSQLATPEAQSALASLRLVFAFGDEGGAGRGGVQDEAFLNNLPGEVAFLDPASVQPGSFPSAFNAATGAFDLDATGAIVGWWQAKNGIAPTEASGFGLVDAAGNRLDITPDANTLIVGAATWCGATKKLVAALETPEVAAELEGLRIVFAFDQEGGDGPGGVLNPDFLNNLPGEVAFLAPGSVRPERLPMAFNAATGQFDLTAVDALNAWASGTLLTGGTCGNKNLATEPGASAPRLMVADDISRDALASGSIGSNVSTPAASAGGASGSCALLGDYNMNGVVDAADFTVWQDTFGAMGVGLAADGSGNNEIDAADYQVWVDHFGEACPAGPGTFTITAPTATQTQKDITVSWSPSENATSYQFVLSRQADLTLPILAESLAGTSKELFLHNGTYYVGVTAINGDGQTVATNQGLSFQVVLPPESQIIFVTSLQYFVDPTNAYPPGASLFGSALAADYHCTNLANNAGLLPEPWDFQKIYYRALVTQAAVGIIDRSGMADDVYYNTSGSIVADNLSTLLEGEFGAPILTQNKTQLTGTQRVWTGANSDSSASLNSKCGNWSLNTGTGTVGNLNGVGTEWISFENRNCTSQARFYCVGDMPSSYLQPLMFDDVEAGTALASSYGGQDGLSFDPDWNVANDTLGGQLAFTGNYINFTQPVTSMTYNSSIRLQLPVLASGSAGLAGFTVTAKNAGGTVLATETIPPVDPGVSRAYSEISIAAAGVASYEFTRIENPNAPGAPAPLDGMILRG